MKLHQAGMGLLLMVVIVACQENTANEKTSEPSKENVQTPDEKDATEINKADVEKRNIGRLLNKWRGKKREDDVNDHRDMELHREDHRESEQEDDKRNIGRLLNRWKGYKRDEVDRNTEEKEESGEKRGIGALMNKWRGGGKRNTEEKEESGEKRGIGSLMNKWRGGGKRSDDAHDRGEDAIEQKRNIGALINRWYQTHHELPPAHKKHAIGSLLNKWRGKKSDYADDLVDDKRHIGSLLQKWRGTNSKKEAYSDANVPISIDGENDQSLYEEMDKKNIGRLMNRWRGGGKRDYDDVGELADSMNKKNMGRLINRWRGGHKREDDADSAHENGDDVEKKNIGRLINRWRGSGKRDEDEADDADVIGASVDKKNMGRLINRWRGGGKRDESDAAYTDGSVNKKNIGRLINRWRGGHKREDDVTHQDVVDVYGDKKSIGHGMNHWRGYPEYVPAGAYQNTAGIDKKNIGRLINRWKGYSSGKRTTDDQNETSDKAQLMQAAKTRRKRDLEDYYQYQDFYFPSRVVVPYYDGFTSQKRGIGSLRNQLHQHPRYFNRLTRAEPNTFEDDRIDEDDITDEDPDLSDGETLDHRRRNIGYLINKWQLWRRPYYRHYTTGYYTYHPYTTYKY